MSIKIQIQIKGLAVCYLPYLRGSTTIRQDSWKIVFLCDDNHKLILKDHTEKEHVLGSHQRIDIDVHDSVSSGSSFNSDLKDHFTHIFNIVDDAHTGGVNFANEMPPTPEPSLPPHRHKVLMSIPHAKLGTYSRTKDIYGIKTNEPDSKYFPLNTVADVVSADIELNAGGRIEIKVDGTKIIQVDTDATLIFDNDCRPLATTDPACRSENDSQMFYEIIQGRENPPLRYIFGRIMEDSPKDKSEDSLKAESEDSSKGEKQFLFHPDGNCDPISSEPPPG